MNERANLLHEFFDGCKSRHEMRQVYLDLAHQNGELFVAEQALWRAGYGGLANKIAGKRKRLTAAINAAKPLHPCDDFFIPLKERAPLDETRLWEE
jgi:hypothetical protein